MSSDNSNAASDMTEVCASCGIADSIDDVNLKGCDGCDLVRYCGDECQELHLPQHKKECRKRAAELRDELLFKQPESSHLGDCPICCLPLSLDLQKSSMYTCCCKFVCNGCKVSDEIRVMEMKLAGSCPFCREPTRGTDKEREKRMMKRIEVNDPIALCRVGMMQYNKGDFIKAFELLNRAAELGDARAHYNLAYLYQNGKGVEKDREKEIYHREEAAICGHPEARYKLGCYENVNRNIDRAVKHWIIAATQGEDNSVTLLMEAFKCGLVEKEDLASALRAHQAAVNATKSPQREAADRAEEK